MILFWTIFDKWERFVIAFLIGGVILLGIGVKVRDFKIIGLESDLNKTKTSLYSIQNSLKNNAIAYQDEIKKYKKLTEDIKKSQKVKIVQIKQWEGDKNASDCENANSLLGYYIF